VKTGGSIRVYANTSQDEVFQVDGKATLRTARILGNISVEGTWTALGNVEYVASEFTLNSNTATNADASIRNNRVVGDDAFIRWDETDDQWKVSKGNTYSSLYGILDASFLNATVTSNSTSNVATSSAVKAAYDTAVFAGGYANSAYTTANSAGSYANSAYTSANSAGVYANAAFLASNTANTFLINTSSIVGSFANGAYARGNTALTHANSAYNQANTGTQFANSAGVYANAAFALSNIADQRAVTSGSYANSAYTTANSAVVSLVIAEQNITITGSYANSAYALANTIAAGSNDTYARPHANAAFAQANTANTLAVGAVQRTSASSQTVASDLVFNGNLSFFNNTKGIISYNSTISGVLAANTGFVTVNNGLSDTSGPTQNGGIRVKRGTSSDAFVRWNENISPPRWQYSDNAGNFIDFNAASLLSGKATNIAGGAANKIPVQSALDTTVFIDAPTQADRFLQWTGSAFSWVPVVTDLSNLSASNLTSGSVPAARMSGTYTMNITGNATFATTAGSVTNGVTTTGSFANPSWITSLAYDKLTGAPTNLSSFTNGPGYLTSATGITGAIAQNGMEITAAGGGAVNFRLAGSYTGTWNVTGAIIASGNITAFSDRKLKENLEKISGALAKVRSLTGYTYTRNDIADKTKRYTGLIAQDVELVLPEVVEEQNGIKGVAYGNMMGLVFEAIKELDDKLEEIKKQLNN
jgi:hypothetical protein